MADLESILSGVGGSSPAPEAPTPDTTTVEPGAAPQASPGAPEADDDTEPQGDIRGMVPVSALRAERQKKKETAKRYTEQVAEFNQRLEQQNAQWERRLTQMFGAIQPRQEAPAAPVEPPPAPDIWDDPNAFVEHGVQQRLQEALSPVTQQLQTLQRGIADMQFTPEAVAEAEAVFNHAAANRMIDPEVHRRINSSPNPWAAAVQWLHHVRAMSEIGGDPAAFRQRVAEEERQRIMTEMGIEPGQGQGGQQVLPPNSRPPNLPSNFATGRNAGQRSGPGWAGPQPLDDIFSTRRQH